MSEGFEQVNSTPEDIYNDALKDIDLNTTPADATNHMVATIAGTQILIKYGRIKTPYPDIVKGLIDIIRTDSNSILYQLKVVEDVIIGLTQTLDPDEQ